MISQIGASTNSHRLLIRYNKLTTYTKVELSALLMYYQVTDISGMQRVEKDLGQLTAPTCYCWSSEDERRLMHLTSQPSKIGNTTLGRHQEVIKRQVSNVIAKLYKEERSGLKCKSESMDENPDSPEVEISVMPNLQVEISSTAKDEHAPLE